MDLYRRLEEISKKVSTAGDIEILEEPKKIESLNWMTSFFGFEDSGISSIFSKSSSNEDRDIIIKEVLQKYAVYDKETGKLRTSAGNYEAGWFIHPTVDEIKQLVAYLKPDGGKANIVVVQGKDIGAALVESPPYQTFQGASQLNSLEMINLDKTPFDGISDYIKDNTQGPRTALACAPGTFVRNYWVTDTYGDQFNALKKLKISHINGYLVWGSSPQDMTPIINRSNEVMIPCMIYTQVAGITVGNTLHRHETPKRTHQIYSSAAPVNAYRNSGNLQEQLRVARALILAEYIGTIGMGIALHEFDKAAGIGANERPQINLTLIGAGVFNVPEKDVIDQIKLAVDVYPNRSFDVYIHGYSPNTAQNISKTLDVPIVKFGTLATQQLQPTQVVQSSIDVGDDQSSLIPPTLVTEVANRFLIAVPATTATVDGVKFYPLRQYQSKMLFEFITSGKENMKFSIPGIDATFIKITNPIRGTLYGLISIDNVTKYFADSTDKNIKILGENPDGSVVITDINGDQITQWP